MAKDTVTLTCCECGKEFEYTFYCQSRKECDSYGAYLKHSDRACKACYAAEMARKRDDAFAEFCKDFPLPEIEAVSDKQRDYAASLRRRYIQTNMHNAKNAASFIRRINPATVAAGMAETGMDRDAYILASFAEVGYAQEYITLTESSARKLIDSLKGC